VTCALPQILDRSTGAAVAQFVDGGWTTGFSNLCVADHMMSRRPQKNLNEPRLTRLAEVSPRMIASASSRSSGAVFLNACESPDVVMHM
jgi:hypothetical protein